MTTEEHLREMLMPLIWDLTVRLATARAEIDKLREALGKMEADSKKDPV